jgi:hypothetical protein
MNLRAAVLFSVFAAGCAQGPQSPEGTLLENHSETASRVEGLMREGDGPFLRGAEETLTARYDAAHVTKLEWTASAGALSAKGARVKWTLPDAASAELTLTLTLDDGAQVVTPFGFSLVERENPHAVKSASEALLATPVQLLDGGVAEISGGACELEYDSSANVHLAFTSSTHPAVYYGKWNGSTWALEVVDTLGFNTGGRIAPSQVHVKVDGSGAPHLLYVRDFQVWYATKSGSTWTRERVDTNATYPAYNAESRTLGFALNASGRPSVLFEYYSSSWEHAVFATRTAANTWTSVPLTFAAAGTNYASRVRGDLLFDSSGTAYFPIEVYGSTTNGSFVDLIGSWNGTATDNRTMMASGVPGPGWDLSVSSLAWAGTGRFVARTAAGLYDFTIGTPLTASTWTFSANEQNGAGVGDVAWNGRPVMLHHHSGGSMELVTPSAVGASFWTWTQLGTSSGVSASVAVHPTTGVASICYQAGGRIMFQ